ncbi:GyrI-like domain-containing protein [Fervidibacillus albus]|uniref:Effector binding domain-containing protein n=1 Tax=Fervidibacillus albus TaxID=2980026 RepID=A0A9E8LT26_9BACI|nr:effector binding domain-containing protein [Fervidibacillus albus]WAA09094.1 effector binding domain-containing protein [Fervidibacillus albus]
MNQVNDVYITSKEGFFAVGLKWEGTFQEANEGAIRKVQKKLQSRLGEIHDIVNEDTMLGLSYHAKRGKETFIHYAAVEVKNVSKFPNDMFFITVPPLSYATTSHKKHQKIDQSYENVYNWIKKEGYLETYPDGLTHMEYYPMKQDPFTDNPEFEIRIPVVPK